MPVFMIFEDFKSDMLKLYDKAQELAQKEAKDPREVFGLLCEVLALELKNKQLRLQIEILKSQIKDTKSVAAMLLAMKKGKVGQG